MRFILVRARYVLTVLSMGALVACAPPTVIYQPVGDAVTAQLGRPLELCLTTGERYIISRARVERDSLYAIRHDEDFTKDAEIVVPVSRIASLAQAERGLTTAGAGAAGLLTGVMVGALLIIGVIFASYAGS